MHNWQYIPEILISFHTIVICFYHELLPLGDTLLDFIMNTRGLMVVIDYSVYLIAIFTVVPVSVKIFAAIIHAYIRGLPWGLPFSDHLRQAYLAVGDIPRDLCLILN